MSPSPNGPAPTPSIPVPPADGSCRAEDDYSPDSSDNDDDENEIDIQRGKTGGFGNAMGGVDDDDDDDEDLTTADASRGTTNSNYQNHGGGNGGGDGNGGLDDDFENKAVRCFRILFFLVLVFAMAAAGACTYLFIVRDQQDTFAMEFDLVADSITQESDVTLRNIMDDMDSLASSITAIATGSETRWPNFTTSSFPSIGGNFRSSTTARLVAIAPIVTTTSIKEDWQTYSIQHQGWVSQGLLYDYQKMNMTVPDRDRPMLEDEIPKQVYRRVGPTRTVPDEGVGPFVPLWQMSPAPFDPSPINFNLLSDPKFASIFRTVQSANVPVLSLEMDSTESLFGTSAGPPGHPTSIMVQPVQSYFDPLDEGTTEMVATLVAEFLWATFFDITIYEHTPSVYLVVNNNCSDPFTFAVSGDDVTFLGYGDLHETEFDAYQTTHPFASFLMVQGEGTSDDGTGNANSSCHQPYMLHIYPSTEFYNTYRDNQRAAAITAIVVSVFAAASIILCLYDCAVHIRQRRILAIAAQSERILSVLYPKTIRDRLFNGLHNNMNGRGSSQEGLMTSNHNSTTTATAGGMQDGKTIGEKGLRTKLHHSMPLDILPHHRAIKNRLLSFMNDDGFYGRSTQGDGGGTTNATADSMAGKPIADFFPHTTVLFADIVGFTAWSSVREPSQVFTLLETVYRAFDIMARRRGVFKVETVGDCYVAVTGLPEPREDHALAMARFARDCVRRFIVLVGSLETTLGPDTAELGIRCGMHSGPVTAGVLRGDRSRFQLFGDTVNTAARIETTGEKNRIHVSQETAEQIQSCGKDGWLQRREQPVEAKGKGMLKTYWLLLKSESIVRTSGPIPESALEKDAMKRDLTASPRVDVSGNMSLDLSSMVVTTDGNVSGIPDLSRASVEEIEASLPPKILRLVKWNVDVLSRLLRQIVANRNAVDGRWTVGDPAHTESGQSNIAQTEADIRKKFLVLDEVVEIIPLPAFDRDVHRRHEDPTRIVLPSPVLDQMLLFVSCIAAMYRPHAFHNFEHASHVTMSVSKLLSRIVSADAVDSFVGGVGDDEDDDDDDEKKSYEDAKHNHHRKAHDHTYGITSDPLTQFSVVLAALIHDVDHLGVSNVQLVEGNHPLAVRFKNKSIAEQNSVVLAWDTLMEPRFVDLRQCIYSTTYELHRFRQLVVNTVLATDIFDRDLSALRKARWDRAFRCTNNDCINDGNDTISVSSRSNDEEAIITNRKATIVIEHLIQASDVAHTMQHWHVYVKWNERLFAEMTAAYNRNRQLGATDNNTNNTNTNPAENWYVNELGFMDHYVIPLAKKLQECGVFGVSSDEYLNYALENRQEWANKGEEIVRTFVAWYQQG